MPDLDYVKRPVAICGAGNMGRRIAVAMAVLGNPVHLFDKNADARQSSENYVAEYLKQTVEEIPGAEAGIVKIFDNAEEAVKNAWLTIESIPEIQDIKTEMLGKLDALVSADCIIGSNSSSFPTSQLIAKVKRPERVINIHFFRPPLTSAVEIMSCGKTDPEVIAFVMRVLPKFRLVPFHVRKESQGFIFNRIWAAVKREALCVAAEGVATPQEVDEMFSHLGDVRAGVFRYMDIVGLDVVYDIERHYAQTRPGLSSEPLEYLKKNYLDKGLLGVKTHRGFYAYPEKDMA